MTSAAALVHRAVWAIHRFSVMIVDGVLVPQFIFMLRQYTTHNCRFAPDLKYDDCTVIGNLDIYMIFFIKENTNEVRRDDRTLSV